MRITVSYQLIFCLLDTQPEHPNGQKDSDDSRKFILNLGRMTSAAKSSKNIGLERQNIINSGTKMKLFYLSVKTKRAFWLNAGVRGQMRTDSGPSID